MKIGSYGNEACLKRKLSTIDYCKLGQIFLTVEKEDFYNIG